MIKSLENTLSKLLKSLDFYDGDARHKVAIGRATHLRLCIHAAKFYSGLMRADYGSHILLIGSRC